MLLPQPAFPLTDACAVLHNNTLYAYTAQAFQALDLSQGAQWRTLKQGQSVEQAVCVGSTPIDPSTAAFFVVGGQGRDPKYQGLQKFVYATNTWVDVNLTGRAVTEQRIRHGAAYLEASDSIVVYAGSQDGSPYASTTTFTIDASAPFQVRSYSAAHVPPATKPILLPWSPTQVVMVGGGQTNNRVMLFSKEAGWQDSGATLAHGLAKERSAIQAMLLTVNDGSKHLLTFDMTVSPNLVERWLLMHGSGLPLQNAAPVLGRSTADEKQVASLEPRQSLTESSWPAYNSSLAPTVTRASYALASDKNGKVLIAGGSTDEVLCIFDARSNAWVNASAIFDGDPDVFSSSDTNLSSGSLSLSSESSASSSSSPSLVTAASLTPSMPSSVSVAPSAAAPSTASSNNAADAATAASSRTGTSTNAILASVLGSIFGLFVIISLVYWCVRRHRSKQKPGGVANLERSGSANSMEHRGMMDFKGDTFPPPPGGAYHGHQSHSSIAILMGLAHQSKPSQSTVPKGMGSTRRTSSDSMFNKAFKNTISKPIPVAEPVAMTQASAISSQGWEHQGVSSAPNTAGPRPRKGPDGAVETDDTTRRSSGWNRYWSGGSALNLLSFGNGTPEGNDGGLNSGHNDPSVTNSRATVVSDHSAYSDVHRITPNSATVPPLNVHNEPRASYSRVNLGSPTISQFNDAHLQQGIRGQIGRSASISSRSAYSSGIAASVHEGWDPTGRLRSDMGHGGDWAAQQARAESSFYSASEYTAPQVPGSQVSTRPPTEFMPAAHPSGLSTQPQLAVAAVQGDMSWLNLGAGAKKRGI